MGDAADRLAWRNSKGDKSFGRCRGRRRLTYRSFQEYMNLANEGSVTQIVGKFRDGDSTAAGELWRLYFPRLLGLARKTLGSVPTRAEDAEDAVQSAFTSFWKQATSGAFTGEMNRDRLWKLLGVITVRKVLRQKERARAQKRGPGQVLGEAALAGTVGDGADLDQLFGTIAPPDFDLCCEELLLRLDEEPRAIALLRLMGYTNREIAVLLDCSERKVERKLHVVRMTWEEYYSEDSLSDGGEKIAPTPVAPEGPDPKADSPETRRPE